MNNQACPPSRPPPNTHHVIFHASHSDFLNTRITMSRLPVGGTPHTQATPASAGRRASSVQGGGWGGRWWLHTSSS